MRPREKIRETRLPSLRRPGFFSMLEKDLPAPEQGARRLGASRATRARVQSNDNVTGSGWF
jgi:hypothetical protein